MSRPILRTLALAAITMVGVSMAHSQGWDFCEDPTTFSPDYNLYPLDTPLLSVAYGVAGTVSTPRPVPDPRCLPPNGAPYTNNITGRYGFASIEGSVQTVIDDEMMYTMGMPDHPANTMCLSAVSFNGTRTIVGANGFNVSFIGASDRYFKLEDTEGNYTVDLNVDLLGDGARFDYIITNTTTAQAQVGLWQGGIMALLDANGNVEGMGFAPLFISIPNQHTPLLETRWTRKVNPSVFPPSFDICWSQSQPYGLRIETGPSASTTDPVTGVSDATQADGLDFGNAFFNSPHLIGAPSSVEVLPDGMFPFVHFPVPGIQQSDIPYTDDPGYILKYDEAPINAGASREIVQYFRPTWGQSNYAAPYTVIIDAPKLINYDPNGLNQLNPNPSTFRVWVDNIKGFTTAEQEVALQNVRITLDLSNSPGLTIQGGGKTQTKTIAKIDSRDLASVDFSVVADGVVTGTQNFSVHVVAPPGPTKTVNAITDISTTPKLPVTPGSNLITAPWNFSDSSWDSILGLSQPTQFQAYIWDASQQGYVFSSSAQRGQATWLIINDPSEIPLGYVQLGSNPTLPTDMSVGEIPVSLSQGWNLIGDPYPYPILLGDLLGVSAGTNNKALSWADLVSAHFVSPSLAYWDTTGSTPSYKFISGNGVAMQPNVGYWIYVYDLGLTLQYPAVFQEGANVGFSTPKGASPALAAAKTRSVATPFVQTAAQYRLMISARTAKELDDQNFVGKADNATDAEMLKILEPPMGPKQNLALSIGSDKQGESRLAQSLLSTTGPLKWTVYVQSNTADKVTVTWPNMSTVPKNVNFRLTDTATGTARDMRQTSGYTFDATANSTRVFSVEATQGTVAKATIGNVVVSQPGKSRDRNAPFTISYTLSANATTTVRILGAGGREIYTATRGRADVAGENSTTWALRDNANRAVAPGIYRVEITAETADGERVRKIVPVTVIR